VDVIIWSLIEVHTAMICASFMTLRPLFVKCIPAFFNTEANSSETGASSQPVKKASLSKTIDSKISSEKGNFNRVDLMSTDALTKGKGESDFRSSCTKTLVFDTDNETKRGTSSTYGLPVNEKEIV
jgi:hypothetical protein